MAAEGGLDRCRGSAALHRGKWLVIFTRSLLFCFLFWVLSQLKRFSFDGGTYRTTSRWAGRFCLFCAAGRRSDQRRGVVWWRGSRGKSARGGDALGGWLLAQLSAAAAVGGSGGDPPPTSQWLFRGVQEHRSVCFLPEKEQTEARTRVCLQAVRAQSDWWRQWRQWRTKQAQSVDRYPSVQSAT